MELVEERVRYILTLLDDIVDIVRIHAVPRNSSRSVVVVVVVDELN